VDDWIVETVDKVKDQERCPASINMDLSALTLYCINYLNKSA